MTNQSKIKWAQARNGERIGSGIFVFRRHRTSGRIAPNPQGRPFEHESLERALATAEQLAAENPGNTFVVVQAAHSVVKHEAAEVAA